MSQQPQPQHAEVIAGASNSFATPTHTVNHNDESACSNVPPKKTKRRVTNETERELGSTQRQLQAALRKVERLEKENEKMKEKMKAYKRPTKLPK